MKIDDFGEDVIVTAERGCYLKFKADTVTEDIVGQPERIIFSKRGIIPEFVEVPLSTVVTEEPQKKPAKTTKKKSSK